MGNKFIELRQTKAKLKFLEEAIKVAKIRVKLQEVTCRDSGRFVWGGNKTLSAIEKELTELENEKRDVQNRSEFLLQELNRVPEIPRQIAMYRKVDMLRWEEISQKTGYSFEQLKKFYKQAKQI